MMSYLQYVIIWLEIQKMAKESMLFFGKYRHHSFFYLGQLSPFFSFDYPKCSVIELFQIFLLIMSLSFSF